MFTLPLLLALAVAAGSPASPPEAAPEVAPPAGAPVLTAAPASEPVAAPAASAPEEEDGPQVQVAPPGAPGEAPTPAPAEPFVLGGFQAPERVVVGAVARVGGSRQGVEVGLDVTVRHRGFVGGVTVGGAQEIFETTNTLGLLAGYGLARGRYRGEALLGWGVASEEVLEGLVPVTRVGHFRSLQAGLDRACWGGDGWRASLGLGLWWRETFGLAASPSSHAEVGAGLRLGVETGW